jgi:hypothetical protein
MDAERNRRNLRRVRGIVKYGAALLTLMGAIHCALILFEVEHIYCHLLWCGFALTLGVYLNRLFCLCRLHLVCVWYICTELGSILENIGQLGAPIPKFLCRAIAVLKSKVDETADNIDLEVKVEK